MRIQCACDDHKCHIPRSYDPMVAGFYDVAKATCAWTFPRDTSVPLPVTRGAGVGRVTTPFLALLF